MELKQIDNKLFRIDKNIAKSGIDFKKSFGSEDGQLIFDMMLYIADSYQEDLFSFGNIDMKDFSKKLGYSYSRLRELHPDPVQLDELGINYEDIGASEDISKEDLFLNRFENALYKAGKYNLTFSGKVKDFQKEDINYTNFYQLVNEISKHKVIQSGKFYYTFVLSDVFRNHLSKFFVHMHVDTKRLISLRKSNTTFLYFFLRNMQISMLANKDPNEKVVTYLDFDNVCRIAEIEIKRPAAAKVKLKKKIERCAEINNMKISVHFEHKNENSKYKYQLKIFFFDNGKDNLEYLIHEKNTAFQEALHDLIEYEMMNLAKKHLSRSRMPKSVFISWIKSEANSKDKFDLFQSIYLQMNRKVSKFGFESVLRRNYDRFIATLTNKYSNINK